MGFVYSADADTDFVHLGDSVQTCDDWYTNGHFLLFDCPLTVFDEWYTVPIVKKKHSKPLVYKSSQVYRDCTNSVPIVKNSQTTVKTAQK